MRERSHHDTLINVKGRVSGFRLTWKKDGEEEFVSEEILMKELPVEERPRERLMRLGPEALSNPELLAILIGSGTNDQSAISLARRLLALDERGVAYLADCQPEELAHVKGMGIAKICRIFSAIELGKRLASRRKESRTQILGAEDVSRLLMEEMRYLKKEHFRALLLNVKNEVIMIDQVAVGGLSSAKVHPREVFANAIRKSASSVILVHNHPSGDPKPSQKDVELTDRLQAAGEILGIEVLDHVIIGDGVYSSLKERFFM